jgi:hypothetical protein
MAWANAALPTDRQDNGFPVHDYTPFESISAIFSKHQ